MCLMHSHLFKVAGMAKSRLAFLTKQIVALNSTFSSKNENRMKFLTMASVKQFSP